MIKGTKTYDFFIAGRWRNKEKVLAVRDAVRDAGFSYYCFIENDYSHHRVKFTESSEKNSIMEEFEDLENWRDDADVREIFENDINGVKQSETLLLVLPGGKSSHIESGVAYGLGKKCYAVGEQKETESLYLIFDEIFPNVATLTKFLESKK